MKFYLPYILCIILIIVTIAFAIAAIITNDNYIAGTFMVLMFISVLIATMLFFKLDEENN